MHYLLRCDMVKRKRWSGVEYVSASTKLVPLLATHTQRDPDFATTERRSLHISLRYQPSMPMRAELLYDHRKRLPKGTPQRYMQLTDPESGREVTYLIGGSSAVLMPSHEYEGRSMASAADLRVVADAMVSETCTIVAQLTTEVGVPVVSTQAGNGGARHLTPTNKTHPHGHPHRRKRWILLGRRDHGRQSVSARLSLVKVNGEAYPPCWTLTVVARTMLAARALPPTCAP